MDRSATTAGAGSAAGAPVRAATATADRFDAFISYSHAADSDLAPALRRGLHQLAKPWYRPRAAKVFMDEASLSTNPALWTSITDALSSSRTLLLLCSPQAAASEWVDKEIAFWLEHKSPERLLPVLTDGELVWDPVANDIDFARSTAAPRALQGAFREEPRHLDMRWTATQQTGVALSLQNSRFKDAVADLAAPIRGIPKDELVGDDIRQHQRTRRIARAAVTALVLLLIAAVIGAVLARANAVRAEHRRIDAEARRLGLEATSIAGPPDLAFSLAAEGYRMRPSSATTKALLITADAAPQVVRIMHDHDAPITAVLALDDHRIVSVDTMGVLLSHDVDTGKVLARGTVTGAAFQLVEVPRGVLVVTRDAATVYDPTTLRVVPGSTTPFDDRLLGTALANGGLVVSALSSDLDGEVVWYGSGGAQQVATGLGAPVGLGADGAAVVVLFNAGDTATLRRFEFDDSYGRARWKQVWSSDVSSASFMLHVDAAHGLALIGGVAGQVQVRRLSDGMALDDRTAGSSQVRTIAVSSQGDTVLVGDSSGVVHWIDNDNGANAFDPTVHAAAVSAIALLDDERFVSAGDDGALVVQRLSTLRSLATERLPVDKPVNVVLADPATKRVYVGMEGAVEVIDPRTRTLSTLVEVTGLPFSFAALPDGDLAVGDSDGQVLVVHEGKVVQRMRTTGRTVFALAYSSTLGELVILADDGTITAAPLAAGRLGGTRSVATDAGNGFALSPDGRDLAFQSGNPGPVKIVELSSGRTVHTLPALPYVHRLSFDGTGKRLAIGMDGSVRLFATTSSGAWEAGQLLPLEARPTDLAFRAGELLVADSDGAVSRWDPATGEARGTLSTLADSLAADVASGPESVYIGTRTALVIRDVRTSAVRASACAVLGRPLSAAERRRFAVDATADPCSGS